MSDTPLHNPHDKFFKETFGRTTTAAEFFQTVSVVDGFARGCRDEFRVSLVGRKLDGSHAHPLSGFKTQRRKDDRE